MAELSPIEAHERAIGRVFGDDYAFEIAPYQHPYAWEREQALDLLTDLLDAMDNTKASGGVYFLGSIVLIKSPGSPDAKLVDGQQRLTTLTILLSLLRDLTTDDELRFERRSYVYQKASADKGTLPRYRLLEAVSKRLRYDLIRAGQPGQIVIRRVCKDLTRARCGPRPPAGNIAGLGYAMEAT
jgi:hypothetical protein